MPDIDDVGEQVRYLLDTYRKPSGDRYEYKEIERGTNGKLKYMSLWKLAHSQIKEPKRETLYTLSDFLRVDRGFWNTRIAEWQKKVESEKNSVSKSLQNIQIVTARYLELSPEQQEIVLDVIESLAKRSKNKQSD